MTPDATDALIANLADCINIITEDLESLLEQRRCLIETLREVEPSAATQWGPIKDPLADDQSCPVGPGPHREIREGK